jgi:hypothetical protein
MFQNQTKDNGPFAINIIMQALNCTESHAKLVYAEMEEAAAVQRARDEEALAARQEVQARKVVPEPEPTKTLAADPRDALAQVMAATTTPVLSEKSIADENARQFVESIEQEETGEMIKLGEINARIAPLSITADGLARLGFPHADTDKSAKLYLESSFPKICDALITAIGKAKFAELTRIELLGSPVVIGRYEVK